VLLLEEHEEAQEETAPDGEVDAEVWPETWYRRRLRPVMSTVVLARLLYFYGDDELMRVVAASRRSRWP
jgi:hypothetical protein